MERSMDLIDTVGKRDVTVRDCNRTVGKRDLTVRNRDRTVGYVGVPVASLSDHA